MTTHILSGIVVSGVTMNVTSKQKRRNRMAREQRWDKSWCESSKDFKKSGCKHATTVIRDQKFDKAGAPTHVQEVCVTCGKVSKWGKYIYRKGQYPVATIRW